MTRPDLGNLAVAGRSHHVAEPVLADVAAGMNDHPIADQGMRDRGVGADRAIAADAHVRSDDGAGADQRPGADLGPRSDDGARIDGHPVLDARRRMHDGAGRDALRLEQRGRSCSVRKQPPRHLDEGPIGFRREQDADAVRHAAREALDGEAGAGAGRHELIQVFGLVEECEVAGAGAVERRYSGDAPLGLGGAMRLGPRDGGNLAHGEPMSAMEEKRPAHAGVTAARGPGSKSRAAAETEPLDSVIGLRRQRERVVEAERSKRRLPQ